MIEPLAAITPSKVTPEKKAAPAIRTQLDSTKQAAAAQAWLTTIQKGYCGGKIAYQTGYEPSRIPARPLQRRTRRPPEPRVSLADALVELQRLTERLRRDCPWDREQSERTIVPHTVEEAYEVADAALAGDDAKLLDELGDLLFQSYFLSLLLSERGAGDLEAVARNVTAKLIARHPHVFGDVEATTSARVRENWERLKVEQEARHGVFHDVPETLPALLLHGRCSGGPPPPGSTTPTSPGRSRTSTRSCASSAPSFPRTGRPPRSPMPASAPSSATSLRLRQRRPAARGRPRARAARGQRPLPGARPRSRAPRRRGGQRLVAARARRAGSVLRAGEEDERMSQSSAGGRRCLRRHRPGRALARMRASPQVAPLRPRAPLVAPGGRPGGSGGDR